MQCVPYINTVCVYLYSTIGLYCCGDQNRAQLDGGESAGMGGVQVVEQIQMVLFLAVSVSVSVCAYLAMASLSFSSHTPGCPGPISFIL